MRFPPEFVWGVSTSAFQIEGAEDRAASSWDTFCRQPGRIRDGHTGDVACDHYNRWPEDVALMADLGLTAYRFSISWPRVQPDGRGKVQAKGLAFYDRLVDGLLERGIEPVPTLFHWDLPQPLQEWRGWLDRDTAYRFADYAAVCAQRLADRVTSWITLNEPFVLMALGYGTGEHAPGETLLFDAFPAGHHQLLGHGLATKALRDNGARKVTIANNYSPAWPASDSAEDRKAADAYDVLQNRLFTDPLLLGTYPEFDANMACVRGGDLDIIATPLDSLGVNYYYPTKLSAPKDPALPFDIVPIEDVPVTAFGWPVIPNGLRDLLTGLRDRYGAALPPVVVTESGCSSDDTVGPDGSVADMFRIGYLDQHIRAVREAMDAGVDVRGYFVWSLLDNFEWAEGYHQRFGLVHVDYATQQRTPKASYAWYRDLIAANR